MRSIRAFLVRLGGLFGKERREREIAEEFESHLRMQIDDNLCAGMTPEQARRNALIQSGGVESAKEAYRDRRSPPFVESTFHDFRYAVRMMRKTPWFTAVVVLTIALGVGANTAIFSVIHAALTPLAIPAADRVVMVTTGNVERGWHQFPVSVPDYLDWKASGVFSSLGAFKEAGFNLRSADRSERIDGLNVTKDFFESLSPIPQLGRLFREEDMQAGHNQVVVLTDALWHSNFAGDPGIIGKSVVLDGTQQTVIGVLPKRFPKFGHENIYAPLIFPAAADRGSRSLSLIGRLRAQISVEAARKRLSEMSLQLAQRYPDTNTGAIAEIQALEEAYVEDARTLLMILSGAVGFVLLIACANIANLLLVRGTARNKEMAIRAALGGSRGRLARQLLVENILLALLGGALAVLPGTWVINFVASFHLDELPNADLVTLNSSVLIFNFVLSLLTGIVFGLVPAWQVWKADVNDTLKASARSHTGGFHQRLRGFLVVSEVALTLVLLASAGLILQSFLRLRAADPGYHSRGLLTMKVALSSLQYSAPEKQLAFFDQVVDRARALPGVLSASATDELPTSDNIHGTALHFPDRPEPRAGDVPLGLRDAVMDNYFRTMQIPLIRGRFLAESDRKDSPLVVVVDEWTARRYWPGQDPVGKLLKLDPKAPGRLIVGVVGSVEQPILVRILKGRFGQIYLPLPQDPKPGMTLVLRAAGDPNALITPMRGLMEDMDIDQPLFRVQTMDAARAAGRATQLLVTWLLGCFAGLALLLATIGIYGVVAYNAGQRTREFGIRISLGAQPLDVLRLAVGQGLVLIAIGVAAGLAAAFAVTRLMSSLLFGVRATDPLTFAGVTVLLAAVTLLASYIPARRATKVDPVIALRCE